ncbi:FxSxx-COOH system tetratricopeptide repeat protein [Cohnella suwonensis]|uniref:FxSxx-COOH system tetratricopeptide repeat protein n=1 Tax=Cohnella suwonensis TaxID=696072 RepID=A0ABW0M0M6_9BACL
MEFVNVLHLSDLHFDMESPKEPTFLAKRYNALSGISRLLQELPVRERPNLVVVSGDITWQGKPSGFEKAAKWLKSILALLGLDDSRLVVCAGNHDLERGKTLGMNPPQSSEDADLWLSYENLTNFTRPFDSFNTFCADFPVTPLSTGMGHSYLTGVREICGLRIIVLNSAWFCRGREDRSKLWLGLPQMQFLQAQALLANKEDYDQSLLTLAVVHHPKEWFHDADQRTYPDRPGSYPYLAERSHLILSGHVHASPERPDHINDKAFVICGGASYAGSGYRNSFAIVRINVQERSFTQIPYEYDPRAEEWERRKSHSFFLTEPSPIEVPVLPTNPIYSRLFHVPFRQHPNFTGRDQEMEELRAKLTSGKFVSLVQTISGLGGIGKTQLAVEYAYKYMDEYQLVWWIRAEDHSTILSDMEMICRKLYLPVTDTKDETNSIVRLLHGWLQKHSNWLLIFDNADNEAELYPYIPTQHQGNVLITSRNPNWEQTITLDVWKRPHSVGFLLKRTGLDDEATAARIAEELGNLPLALEQASAYIRQTRISMKDYLERFQSYTKEMIARGRPFNDQLTVSATWNISFEAVQQKIPASREFIRFCSFLAGDSIPKSMFIYDGKVVEGWTDKILTLMDLDDIVAEFLRFSLIQAKENHFSIHRLVQAVVRDELTHEERVYYVRFAVRELEKLTYSLNGISFDPQYVPHLSSVVQYAENLEVDMESFLHLKERIFTYYMATDQYKLCEDQSSGLLELVFRFYGDRNPKTAIWLHTIGILYYRIGNPVKAQEHIEQALANDEIHPANKANFLNSLASVERMLSQLDKAKRYIDQALKTYQLYVSEADEQYLTLLNTLGYISHEMGLHEEAESHYKKVIEVGYKNGNSEELIATALGNIGQLYVDKGEFEKSIGYFLRAIEISQSLQDKSLLTRQYNNLGLSYYYLTEYDKALRYFKKALRLRKDLYNEYSFFTAVIYNNIALIHSNEGDYVEAERSYKKVLDIYRFLKLDQSLDAAACYLNLGRLYQHLNQFNLAQEHMEMALALDRQLLVEPHMEIVKDLTCLAMLYVDKREPDQAIEVSNQCKSMIEALGQTNRLEYSSNICAISLAYLIKGQIDLSKKLFEQSMRLIVRDFSLQHENSYSYISNYTALLKIKGVYKRELHWFRKLIRSLEES